MTYIDLLQFLGVTPNHRTKTWMETEPRHIEELLLKINKLLSQNDLEKRRTLEKIVARISISRINDEVKQPNELFWSVTSDMLLSMYGDYIAKKGEQLLQEKGLRNIQQILPLSDQKFLDLINETVVDSHCSANHPIFNFLKNEAGWEVLSEYLWAENLCDLNFVNILGFLMQGLEGVSGLEIARNFFDEIGEFQLDKFHTKLRRDMMYNVGLPILDEDWNIDTYLTPEYEHFNAYCSYGFRRDRKYRLIGMMLATEHLVPSQQEYVLSGWLRVGLPEAKMAYILEHIVGDVTHSQGWFNNVVKPNIANNLFRQTEILIGVHQHLEILGRLYDAMYQSFKSDIFPSKWTSF